MTQLQSAVEARGSGLERQAPHSCGGLRGSKFATPQQQHSSARVSRAMLEAAPPPPWQAKPRDDKAQCAQRVVVRWPLVYGTSSDGQVSVSAALSTRACRGTSSTWDLCGTIASQSRARNDISRRPGPPKTWLTPPEATERAGANEVFSPCDIFAASFSPKGRDSCWKWGTQRMREWDVMLRSHSAATVTAVITSGACVDVP